MAWAPVLLCIMPRKATAASVLSVFAEMCQGSPSAPVATVRPSAVRGMSKPASSPSFLPMAGAFQDPATRKAPLPPVNLVTASSELTPL